MQEEVGGEGAYDYEVVQDGREGGQEEAAVGLEHPGCDGGHTVEEHLQGEDPEEEYPVLLGPSGLRGGESPRGLPGPDQANQGTGEHDADEGEQAHERQDQGKEGVRQAAGVVLAVGSHPVH